MTWTAPTDASIQIDAASIASVQLPTEENQRAGTSIFAINAQATSAEEMALRPPELWSITYAYPPFGAFWIRKPDYVC